MGWLIVAVLALLVWWGLDPLWIYCLLAIVLCCAGYRLAQGRISLRTLIVVMAGTVVVSAMVAAS